jgi:DNA-binding NtrC family response regulator
VGADRKSVLLVEDDEAVRDVVQNALIQAGCDVETAANGDAAIELIRAGNEYDLIFTDMIMAGDAGGREVATAARAAAPGVPVIFCSGFPRRTLGGEEASLEGAFFLAKPFHQHELVSIVQRAFKRAAAASSITGK